MSSTAFVVAFLGGLIPALFWLYFWLKEDRNHPEPKLLIVISFIAGMMVVPFVLPLQQFAIERFTGDNLIFVWVIIEEVLKFIAALLIVLWNRAVDEPVDAIIYMIAIALGFSALENSLFICAIDMTNGGGCTLLENPVHSFVTGSFRFLGATLLHVLASGTIGIFIALSFYKRTSIKIIAATIGLFVAIMLHALFNFFIMDASGSTVLGVFMFVWMGIIVLFLIFEKVKLLEKKHNRVL